MTAPRIPPELQQTTTTALFFQKLLDYIASLSGGGTTIEAGTVEMFAGSSVPSGWLECNGDAVSRTTYADLFSAIGTTWGAGDGSTTFNLPDLRGRAPIGVGTGASLTARALADTGGAEDHTLTTSELPAHNHSVTDSGHGHGVTDSGHAHGAASGNFAVTGSGLSSVSGSASLGTQANTASATTGVTINSATTGISIDNTGSDAAHNNMQPFAAVKFMVKT